MRRPWCVALTGGIAAGKSQVAEAFACLGVDVIDTDALARALIEPGGAARAAVIAEFGALCLRPDGTIDRRALRAHVFVNAEARARLESILHPAIRTAAERALTAATSPYALLVVPLLVEHFEVYRPLFDRVLVVDCPPEIQHQRLLARDGIDAQFAQRMLAAQAERALRLRRADDVLDNTDALETIPAKVSRLHARYLALAQSQQ